MTIERGALLARWSLLLPQAPDLGADLLRRWSEPHRRYHDLRHLGESLTGLDRLGGGPAEQLALWFHDAVHSMTPGVDEQASADLAAARLAGVLASVEVSEVVRLVLVTGDHRPDPDDDAGQRVCDADLCSLAAPWPRYREAVQDLRREWEALSGPVPEDQWLGCRRRVLGAFGAGPLYATRVGRAEWEAAAAANLAREAAELDAARLSPAAASRSRRRPDGPAGRWSG